MLIKCCNCITNAVEFVCVHLWLSVHPKDFQFSSFIFCYLSFVVVLNNLLVSSQAHISEYLFLFHSLQFVVFNVMLQWSHLIKQCVFLYMDTILLQDGTVAASWGIIQLCSLLVTGDCISSAMAALGLCYCPLLQGTVSSQGSNDSSADLTLGLFFYPLWNPQPLSSCSYTGTTLCLLLNIWLRDHTWQLWLHTPTLADSPLHHHSL